MSVSKTDNTALVKNDISNKVGITIRLMLEDAHRIANPVTPKKDGGLRTAVNKQMESNSKGVIEWRVPYAWYQERGYTSGPVVNYTTPGTHAGFAEEGINSVMNNLSKYLSMGGLL